MYGVYAADENSPDVGEDLFATDMSFYSRGNNEE